MSQSSDVVSQKRAKEDFYHLSHLLHFHTRNISLKYTLNIEKRQLLSTIYKKSLVRVSPV
jgi:hypothetical protein